MFIIHYDSFPCLFCLPPESKPGLVGGKFIFPFSSPNLVLAEGKRAGLHLAAAIKTFKLSCPLESRKLWPAAIGTNVAPQRWPINNILNCLRKSSHCFHQINARKINPIVQRSICYRDLSSHFPKKGKSL